MPSFRVKVMLLMIIGTILVLYRETLFYNSLVLPPPILRSKAYPTPVPITLPGVAVLVEPRLHENIIPVTINIMQNIPHDWVIYIFPSSKNAYYIKEHFKSYIKNGKVIVDETVLGDTVNLYTSSYNEILTTPSFWNRIPAEKILVYQLDSIICLNSPRKFTSFLQYDYIGSPWPWNKTTYVGNGGFSLRSRKWSLEVLQRHELLKGWNEDVWFAYYFFLYDT